MARTTDPRLDPHRYGRMAERHAVATLRRAGLRIVERRFRVRRGELDLVAEDGDLLVFVEVRARRRRDPVRPAETVTRAKQRHLARAALAYLQRRGCLERPCRFDVVEVVGDLARDPRVIHFVDAFRPDSG